MNTAIIVGNGKSRSNYDLKRTKSRDNHSGWRPVFGCNALYRDFYPDFLVAIDSDIILEIEKSDFPKTLCIFPPEEERYEPKELYGVSSYKQCPRSNAGMVAMQQAIKQKFKKLICIGFDFLIVDEKQATDNVFAGTNAYGPETKASLADTRNRMKFLSFLIEKNPNVDFVFVYPANTISYMPDLKNVDCIDYKVLEEEYSL